MHTCITLLDVANGARILQVQTLATTEASSIGLMTGFVCSNITVTCFHQVITRFSKIPFFRINAFYVETRMGPVVSPARKW